MDELKPTRPADATQGTTADNAVKAQATSESLARGSAHVIDVPAVPPERPERTENSVMEGLPRDKAERVAAMRRELADLQRQLIEAQQRIATELQGRADDAERIEELEARLQTLEDKAKQHTELTEQLDVQSTRFREANALIATRDAELAAITSERDALKGELDQARRDLEASRAKSRDIANQIVRFGQELAGDGGARITASTAIQPEPPPAVARTITDRQLPPPLPPPRVKTVEPEPELILDVTDEAKPAPSRLRSGLMVVGGLLAGCAFTFAIVKGNNPSSAAAASIDEQASPPAALTAPNPTESLTAPDPTASLTAPNPTEAPVAPTPAPSAEAVVAPPVAPTAPSQPAPGAETVSAAAQPETAAAPAAIATGVIQLPPEADGHRVFVDGRVVKVTDSRAVVPCGARDVRIGSRGQTQKIDVACGGETAVSTAPRARE